MEIGFLPYTVVGIIYSVMMITEHTKGKNERQVIFSFSNVDYYGLTTLTSYRINRATHMRHCILFLANN